MKILFIGNKPTQNFFRVGVIGNNLVDKIKMTLKANQGVIDLSEYNAYLKMANSDMTFADKVQLDIAKDETNEELINLEYIPTAEVTSERSVDMQLSFEKIENNITKIWQSSIFHITFDERIDIASYVSKYYPDVLSEFNERLTKLEQEQQKKVIITVETEADLATAEKDPNKLYIVTDENQLYRYDESSATYEAIDESWQNIKTINCNADE